MFRLKNDNESIIIVVDSVLSGFRTGPPLKTLITSFLNQLRHEHKIICQRSTFRVLVCLFSPCFSCMFEVGGAQLGKKR